MAVSQAVLIVIVVLVTQVECASISRPETLDHNQLESPESTDNLDTAKKGQDDEKPAASLQNQVKIKQDDPDKQPDGSISNTPASEETNGVLTNSHTITSQDFAEKTGVVNSQVPAVPEKPVSSDSSASDSEKNKEPVTTNEDIKTSTGENALEPLGPEDAKANKEDSNLSDPDIKEEAIEVIDECSHSDSDKRSKPSDRKKESGENSACLEKELKTLSLTELSQNITDEIKVYSNEVAMIWEGRKGGASWTTEAEGVLKDYMDKILIAQSANNSNCVKKDLENHASRSESLKDVLESCRTNLKRESWQKLQEKTKSVLNKIKDIVQDATNSIDELSKDDPDFNNKKTDIENKAKQKLLKLYSPSLRNTFATLKEEAITGDENEYIKCIDDKPEKEMIVDTLNDIMRIKNNCVG